MFVKASMHEHKMYPTAKGTLRALRARPNTLKYRLLRPLHSQLHTQHHPLL